MQYLIRTPDQLKNLISDLQERDLNIRVEVKPIRSTRTSLQNDALHKGFELIAEAFNDAGYDLPAILAKKQIPVKWTKDAVKEYLYKPIMEAICHDDNGKPKTSTTQLNRMEVSEVWDFLNKWTGEQFGITTPFPSEEQR